MRIGIFARTFQRTTVEEVLDGVVEQAIGDIQFNMISAGLPSMPESVDPATVARIRAAMDERKLRMASLSGTFNIIHPDPAVREAGLQSLRVLAQVAGPLGTKVLTLCTGTRDPDYMWRNHADNATPEAWSDLLASMEQAMPPWILCPMRSHSDSRKRWSKEALCATRLWSPANSANSAITSSQDGALRSIWLLIPV